MATDLLPTAAHTFEFLAKQLGTTRQRVLEVGCGDGAVAAALARAGHEVTALDADPAMVAVARGRGVDARCVRWPEFEGQDYGAVLFTRSLHHLPTLPPALQRAAQVLVPHGLLVIEELAHEVVDERTVRWLQSMLRQIDGESLLRAEPHLLAIRMLHGADPLAVWRADREHQQNGFDAIEAAVEDGFRKTFRADAPYLYRHVAMAVVPGAAGIAAVRHVMEQEERAGKRGEIAAVGRRLVARAPLAG